LLSPPERLPSNRCRHGGNLSSAESTCLQVGTPRLTDCLQIGGELKATGRLGTPLIDPFALPTQWIASNSMEVRRQRVVRGVHWSAPGIRMGRAGKAVDRFGQSTAGRTGGPLFAAGSFPVEGWDGNRLPRGGQ
jgi:hypothetical protein